MILPTDLPMATASSRCARGDCRLSSQLSGAGNCTSVSVVDVFAAVLPTTLFGARKIGRGADHPLAAAEGALGAGGQVSALGERGRGRAGDERQGAERQRPQDDQPRLERVRGEVIQSPFDFPQTARRRDASRPPAVAITRGVTLKAARASAPALRMMGDTAVPPGAGRT